MKIQIDIPKELNKKLKLFKTINEKINLQEATIAALEDYFKRVSLIKPLLEKGKLK